MRISKRVRNKLLDSLKYYEESDNYKYLVYKVIISKDFNSQDSLGKTLLHYCSFKSDTHLVSMLLEEGANPDIKDNNSNTPLMMSVYNHNWSMFKLLIQNGADVYTKNLNGQSSFDFILKSVRYFYDLVKVSVDNELYNLEDENNIILMLSLIKDIGLLSMDEYQELVSSIYSISYEYLKLKFIYEEDSELFNELKSSAYDREFINDFIKNDLETLSSSVNYVVGNTELKEEIKKIKDDDYFSEEIIGLLSICYYPNQNKKVFNEFMLNIIYKIRESFALFPKRFRKGSEKSLNYYKDNYYSFEKAFLEFLNGRYRCFKEEEEVYKVKTLLKIANNYILMYEASRDNSIVWRIKKLR